MRGGVAPRPPPRPRPRLTNPPPLSPAHDFLLSAYATDPSGLNIEITTTTRGYTEDEYDLTLLSRRMRPDENDHAESDTHGKNVAKSGAIPSKM